ncbi:isopentenyl-diphosphate Delta-isomerase [Jannaschia sp. Os4]|uniref:isopentenyl-diphosphate Delta-isomerase n=1 Tax=Jannaschia sp. Os4 TaxID=2807617 RepID=UPI0019394BA6|nr:isopentenyl-diphosphate Delta-isomerase [Jannaschia sp. Os4]MBM2575517.1 isopentenyl-diphosphate Delta-isomerase [Jannaschia sp. Os4]
MSEMLPAWVEGTLVPVEKLEVHRRGLRHKAISVFVIDGPRTLLQRRALSKYHTPGLWANTCCTHPRMDETGAACAARRLREELGIEGLDLTPRDTIEYRAEVGGGLVEHEVVELFTAEVDAAALRMDLNPDEVCETRWIALPDLEAEVAAHPERFTPWLRIYLADHAERLFGTIA